MPLTYISTTLGRLSTRHYLALITVTISTALCVPLSGQTLSHDQAAVALITSAINAMGGTVVGGPTNLVTTGEQTVFGETRAFTWKEAGSSFRYSYLDSSGVSDEEFCNSTSYYQVHQGSAKLVPALFVSGHFSLVFPVNKLSLLLADNTSSLNFLGPIKLGGKSVVGVRTAEGSGPMATLLTGKTWYFDPQTAQLLAVDYYLPDAQHLSGGATLRATFTNYTQISGFILPFHIAIDTSDKQLPITYTIETASFSTTLLSTTFNIP